MGNREHAAPIRRLLKPSILATVLLGLMLLGMPQAPFNPDVPGLQAAESAEDNNPRANYWRAVRGGVAGYSSVEGDEAGVLIHGDGQNWRQFRTRILAPYGGYIMGGVLGLIVVFALVRGRVRLSRGRSGVAVERFTVYQRVIHWFAVSLFLILTLTGLLLLYGRIVLTPLIGLEGLAIVAAASKEIHNLFGPLFGLALLLLFISFARQNLYARGDMTWLARGGGFFKRHASAGRFNMGEKIWFWMVILAGLAITVSGLVLDFPILGQDRLAMELAHVVHTSVAVILIAVAFGHVYLATWGTEGTLDGMTRGTVDRNWAEEHHDRWETGRDETGTAAAE